MECTLLFTQCNCLVSVQVENMNTRKLLLRAVESKTKCKCSTHEFSSTWVLKVQILMDSQLGKVHNSCKFPRKRSYQKIITDTYKLNKFGEHILSLGKFLTSIIKASALYMIKGIKLYGRLSFNLNKWKTGQTQRSRSRLWRSGSAECLEQPEQRLIFF